MSLKYTCIQKHPTIFLRLFGLTPAQFDHVVHKTTPLWQKKVRDQYQRPGRSFKLSLEDMVLMTLLYYRSYTTQLFIGYLFGVDDSRVCRLIKRLEPLLARVVALNKGPKLSQEEVESLICDATEQPIQRPKIGQQAYYSGKKKRHTLKTEIRVTLQGRLTHVSRSRPGSLHDFKVHSLEPPLPPEVRAYVDSGYQGLDKIHPETELPFKKFKDTPLDPEDKAYNQALSHIRIKVEHILGQMKTFRILADRYRNYRKRYNIKFKIIAGLVNLKNGFGSF